MTLPTASCLGVIMPVYNEQATLETILRHVLANPLVAQVVVVDNGSHDSTPEIIGRLAREDRRIRVVSLWPNQGKGGALRAAIPHLETELAIVQDADLEYDPRDYGALVEPILSHRADVVFGFRGFLGHTAHSFWFVIGNRLVTAVTNVLFNCYLRDIETGYKVLRTSLWKRLQLPTTGFDVDPQIVGRVLRLGYRIHEVPIHYYARSRAEGKKLAWIDGFRALGTLLRLRVATYESLFGQVADDYHRRRQLELSLHHPLKLVALRSRDTTVEAKGLSEEPSQRAGTGGS